MRFLDLSYLSHSFLKVWLIYGDERFIYSYFILFYYLLFKWFVYFQIHFHPYSFLFCYLFICLIYFHFMFLKWFIKVYMTFFFLLDSFNFLLVFSPNLFMFRVILRVIILCYFFLQFINCIYLFMFICFFNYLILVCAWFVVHVNLWHN